MEKRVIAFDYGASGGKAFLGVFDGEKITSVLELHRFANEPVRVGKVLYWDILRLYHELKVGLLKADRIGRIDSVGIDTWGVDFGMLDENGDLLNNPFHYRHDHTKNAVLEICGIVDRYDIFKESGLAFQPFNTLCQLYAMKRDGNIALEKAKTLLYIPDLFSYFLTGNKTAEYSIASTSQLLKCGTTEYSEKLFSSFGIDKSLFPPVKMAGNTIGFVRDEVTSELGLKQKIRVLASAGHDTASAYVAVPSGSKPCAFLSSGTWSLIGTELKEPILSMEALESGYTNEGGALGGIRFLKNIMGLWIIQECMRSWEKEDGGISYKDLDVGTVAVPPCKFIFDANSPEFFQPSDMPQKIMRACAKYGEVPNSRFEIARAVYDALALCYKRSVKYLEELTNKKIEALHIVGGGSKNDILNQASADALNIGVTAGPVEGTAIGNMLVQLVGLGAIKDLAEARTVLKNSVTVKEFTPKNADVYQSAYKKLYE